MDGVGFILVYLPSFRCAFRTIIFGSNRGLNLIATFIELFSNISIANSASLGPAINPFMIIAEPW